LVSNPITYIDSHEDITRTQGNAALKSPIIRDQREIEGFRIYTMISKRKPLFYLFLVLTGSFCLRNI